MKFQAMYRLTSTPFSCPWQRNANYKSQYGLMITKDLIENGAEQDARPGRTPSPDLTNV